MTEDAPRKFDMYELVGMVVTSWNFLENVLKDLVGQMLTPDQTAARIATWDANWQWLKTQLYNLGRYRLASESDLLRDYEAMMQRVHQADERRNTVAHALWQWAAPVDGELQMERLRFRGKGTAGPRIEKKTFSPDELLTVWQEIADTTGVVIELYVLLEARGLIYPHS